MSYVKDAVMDKKSFTALFCTMMLLFSSTYFLACGHGGSASEAGRTEKKTLSVEEKAEQIVGKMSDAQKIGQLMMIGITGKTMDQDARYMLTEFSFGNVILFDRNMETPEQVRVLNQSIRGTVLAQTGVPPLIGVDQEGGLVSRMTDYLPAMPSAEALGKGTVQEAKDWSVKTGTALKKLGFNTNFAPVVDLDSAYHRSYGKTPETVVPFAEAVISGYGSQGIHTALKHFPGIGKVKTDPHLDGDVVMISRGQLDQEDGVPFRELIGRTDPEQTFVMVSNVTYPNLDPGVPACISSKIMTDILRKSYGFTGIILTDDMEMGAMAKHYAFREMGVRAVEAGADIVLVCHDYAHGQEVYNGLLQAYRSGMLDRKMIDDKVKRIVKMKLLMQ